MTKRTVVAHGYQFHIEAVGWPSNSLAERAAEKLIVEYFDRLEADDARALHEEWVEFEKTVPGNDDFEEDLIIEATTAAVNACDEVYESWKAECEEKGIECGKEGHLHINPA